MCPQRRKAARSDSYKDLTDRDPETGDTQPQHSEHSTTDPHTEPRAKSATGRQRRTSTSAVVPEPVTSPHGDGTQSQHVTEGGENPAVAAAPLLKPRAPLPPLVRPAGLLPPIRQRKSIAADPDNPSAPGSPNIPAPTGADPHSPSAGQLPPLRHNARFLPSVKSAPFHDELPDMGSPQTDATITLRSKLPPLPPLRGALRLPRVDRGSDAGGEGDAQQTLPRDGDDAVPATPGMLASESMKVRDNTHTHTHTHTQTHMHETTVYVRLSC